MKRQHAKAYAAWRAMRSRCQNTQHPAYADYGGRGITVCDRWQTFRNFLADVGDPEPGTTLDRIENDRGYEPGNTRWVSVKKQANNRRNTRYVHYEGRDWPLAELAEHIGIPYLAMYQRLARGMSVERIVQRERLNPWDNRSGYRSN